MRITLFKIQNGFFCSFHRFWNCVLFLNENEIPLIFFFFCNLLV